MQSSSAARIACATSAAAFALSILPVPLTPDALARGVQPSLPLTSFFNVEAQAETLPAGQSTLSGATTSAAPATTTPKKVSATTSAANSISPRLVIPTIDLNDPIINVGLDATGAMAVPNGKTNEVGLYDGGPKPGDVGSSVLDAHVFAAFKDLDQVKVGDSIYVNENGQSLHFVVTAVKLYALSDITSQDLFVPTSDRDLNLITCAGKLTPDHSTYDHRLVVYSTLVN